MKPITPSPASSSAQVFGAGIGVATKLTAPPPWVTVKPVFVIVIWDAVLPKTDCASV